MDLNPRVEATRARILNAALDAFVLDGYTGASTDVIAAAAAASKQTVYKYFGDKEGLFRALISDMVDRVHASIVRLDVDDYADGEQVVRCPRSAPHGPRCSIDECNASAASSSRRLPASPTSAAPTTKARSSTRSVSWAICLRARTSEAGCTSTSREWLQINSPACCSGFRATGS